MLNKVKNYLIKVRYILREKYDNLIRQIIVYFITKTSIKILSNDGERDVIFKDVDGILHIEEAPFKLKIFDSEKETINYIYNMLEEQLFLRYNAMPYDEKKLEFFQRKADELLGAVIKSETKVIKEGRFTRWSVWQCQTCGNMISNKKICDECGQKYVGADWG